MEFHFAPGSQTRGSSSVCLFAGSREVPARANRLLFRGWKLKHARYLCVRAVNKDEVLRDVRIVIADQLGRNLEDIKPDNTFVDIGADSLDTVEIMMALEEKFELTLEEEGAEQVRTVEDAADLIARQIDSL